MAKSLSFLSLALGLSFATQAQNTPFYHIPPGSEKVYQLNIGGILSKAGWTEIFDKLPKPTGEGAEFLGILKDPSSAGIDIRQDVIIAQSPPKGADSAVFTTIILAISDSAKFRTTLRKAFKDFKHTPLAAKTAFAGQTGSTLYEGFAWNDRLGIITHFQHSKDATRKPSVDMNVASLRAMTTRKSLETIKGYPNNYFTDDALFQKVFNDGGDAHMLVPQGAGYGEAFKKLNKGKGGNPLAKAIGLNGSKTLTTIRFENGLISLRSLMTSTPQQAELYSKVITRPLNTDLIARLPAGDLLGVVTIHFDPKGLLDVLGQAKEFRAKFDSSVAKMGLTTADIANAFTGDFVIAGIQPPAAPDAPAGSGKGQPTFYFATSIADPVSFLKVTSKIGLIKNPANAAPSGELNLGKMKLAYAFKDNILVLSMSADAANAYFAGTEKRNTDFLSERIKNSVFGIYLDADKVHALLEQLMHNSTKPKDQNLLAALGAFENVSINFGSLADGNFETYVELKMTNHTDNSLRALMNLIPTKEAH